MLRAAIARPPLAQRSGASRGVHLKCSIGTSSSLTRPSATSVALRSPHPRRVTPAYRGSAVVLAAAVSDGGAGDPDSSSSSSSSSSSTPGLISLGDALNSVKNLGKNISPKKFKSLRMLVLALVALVGRGLHSLTSQLNLSALYAIGGELKGLCSPC